MILGLVCVGDKLGSEGKFEGSKVKSRSSTSGFVGTHELRVGKAAGGRSGLNSMIFRCKPERTRVLAGGGRGGGGGGGDGIRSGSSYISSSYRFGALICLRSCILAFHFFVAQSTNTSGVVHPRSKGNETLMRDKI